jgi:hypothetical protein
MVATHALTLSIDILVGRELRVINQQCKNLIYEFMPSSWCAISRILKPLRAKKTLALEGVNPSAKEKKASAEIPVHKPRILVLPSSTVHRITPPY